MGVAFVYDMPAEKVTGPALPTGIIPVLVVLSRFTTAPAMA